MEKAEITVFTPTYNRAKSLPRCFESLKKQTYKDFVWLIIDDGSSDNTSQVVQSFIKEKPFFKIEYVYQENRGKHVAKNRAAEMCNSKFFITLDSDDACTADALETFINEWYKIPEKQRDEFYGISCRTCYEDGTLRGSPMNCEYIDANDLQIRNIYKITGELWGMSRTDIIRAYPSPEIEGFKFYPENIIWNTIGKKYKSRYIAKPLRYYINDQENAITNLNKRKPSKEKYFMHLHFVNDCWEYRKYDRKRYLIHIICLSKDGRANGKNIKQVLADLNTKKKKVLALLLYPIGFIAYKTV